MEYRVYFFSDYRNFPGVDPKETLLSEMEQEWNVFKERRKVAFMSSSRVVG